MPKDKLRRPSRAMMLAVNAAIDRKDREVAQLLKEHNLDTAELEQRLVLRNGRQYDLNGTTQRPTRRRRGAEEPIVSNGGHVDLDVTINGRTSVQKLFKLIEQAFQVKAAAQQELARRKPEDVEPVKKVVAEIELLRRERAKIESKIREAEGALR